MACFCTSLMMSIGNKNSRWFSDAPLIVSWQEDWREALFIWLGSGSGIGSGLGLDGTYFRHSNANSTVPDCAKTEYTWQRGECILFIISLLCALPKSSLDIHKKHDRCFNMVYTLYMISTSVNFKRMEKIRKRGIYTKAKGNMLYFRTYNFMN